MVSALGVPAWFPCRGADQVEQAAHRLRLASGALEHHCALSGEQRHLAVDLDAQRRDPARRSASICAAPRRHRRRAALLAQPAGEAHRGHHGHRAGEQPEQRTAHERGKRHPVSPF